MQHDVHQSKRGEGGRGAGTVDQLTAEQKKNLNDAFAHAEGAWTFESSEKDALATSQRCFFLLQGRECSSVLQSGHDTMLFSFDCKSKVLYH